MIPFFMYLKFGLRQFHKVFHGHYSTALRFVELRFAAKHYGYLIECIYSPKNYLDLFVKIAKGRDKNLGKELIMIHGDYVFIDYNYARREVKIITDDIGKIPTYLYQSNNELILADNLGEIANFVRNRLYNPLTLNQKKIIEKVLWLDFSDSRTVFNEISLLPPATTTVCNPGKKVSKLWFNKKKWLTILSEKPKIDLNTFVSLFETTLKNILREQVSRINKSNGTYSTALSAGLDSSLISGILKELDNNLHAYSKIAPILLHADPKPIIKKFLEFHQITNHVFIDITKTRAIDLELDNRLLKKFLPFVPMGEDLSFVFHKMHKLKKRFLFSGLGGDEIYLTNRTARTYINNYGSFLYTELIDTFPTLTNYIEIDNLNKKYHFEKGPNNFGTVIVPYLASSLISYYPYCSEYDMWYLTPFFDKRLLEVAYLLDDSIIRKRNDIIKNSELSKFYPPEYLTGKTFSFTGIDSIYFKASWSTVKVSKRLLKILGMSETCYMQLEEVAKNTDADKNRTEKYFFVTCLAASKCMRLVEKHERRRSNRCGV